MGKSLLKEKDKRKSNKEGTNPRLIGIKKEEGKAKKRTSTRGIEGDNTTPRENKKAKSNALTANGTDSTPETVAKRKEFKKNRKTPIQTDQMQRNTNRIALEIGKLESLMECSRKTTKTD